MQLPSAIVQYYAWKSIQSAHASTIYRKFLRGFLDTAQAETTEEIAEAHILRYKQFLVGHYHRASIYFGMVALRDFLRFCEAKNIPSYPPKLLGRFSRENSRPYDPVMPEEHTRMLNECGDGFRGIQAQAILQLLWNTGVRAAELVDIQVLDIVGGRRSCKIMSRKREPVRTVVWNDECEAAVMRYRAIRIPASDSPYLFIGMIGTSGRFSTKMTTRTVEEIIVRLSKRAGTPKRTPHCYRYAKGRNAHLKGAATLDIKWMLGHVNIKTTERYVTLFDHEKEARMRMFL